MDLSRLSRSRPLWKLPAIVICGTAILLSALSGEPSLGQEIPEAASAAPSGDTVGTNTCKDRGFDLVTEVPLGNTGIAHWSFLNPRQPYPLVRTGRAVTKADGKAMEVNDDIFRICLPETELRFFNHTVDRIFTVSLPFSFRIVDKDLSAIFNDMKLRVTLWKIASEAQSGRNFVPDEATLEAPLPSPAERDLARKAAETKRETIKSWLRQDDYAREQGLTRTPGDRVKVEHDLEEVEASIRKLDSLQPQKELQEMVDSAQPGAFLSALAVRVYSEPGKVRDALEREGKMREVIQKEATRETDQKKAPPITWEEAYRVIVASDQKCQERLKSFGDAFGATTINSFKDDCLTSLGRLEQSPVGADFKRFSDLFSQDVEGRLNLLLQTEPAGSTKTLSDFCSVDKAAGVFNCSRSLRVGQGSYARVEGSSLKSGEVIAFKVRFFSEAEIPTFDTGYVKTAVSVAEPPNSTQWQFSGAVGLALDPDTALDGNAQFKDPVYNNFKFSSDLPYDGNQRRRFFGTGNLKLAQKLGNRAEGSATLAFKDGDLGGADGDKSQVTVPDYKITLYGNNGLQLLFGKYLIANPQDGVAVAEKGEGLEFRYKWLSLAHVIHRESAGNKANHKDEDNRVTILRFNTLPLRSNSILRSVSLLGLYGQEKKRNVLFSCSINGTCPESPTAEMTTTSATGRYNYWTGGIETFFAELSSRISGSVAHYRSRRDLRGPITYPAATATTAATTPFDIHGALRDGRGNATLLTAAWNSIPPPSGIPGHTVQFRLGYGSGDDPSTPDVDEGYLGETASFSAGQLFLPKFGGQIGSRTSVDVAGGLSNKTYTSLSYSTTLSSLPLEGIARLLGITEAISSKATTLRLHNYRFNEPVFGNRDAGNEIELQFQIEVPKGVMTSVGISRFLPGRALEGVFKQEPWTVNGVVKVTM